MDPRCQGVVVVVGVLVLNLLNVCPCLVCRLSLSPLWTNPINLLTKVCYIVAFAANETTRVVRPAVEQLAVLVDPRPLQPPPQQQQLLQEEVWPVAVHQLRQEVSSREVVPAA